MQQISAAASGAAGAGTGAATAALQLFQSDPSILSASAATAALARDPRLAEFQEEAAATVATAAAFVKEEPAATSSSVPEIADSGTESGSDRRAADDAGNALQQ